MSHIKIVSSLQCSQNPGSESHTPKDRPHVPIP